MSDIYFEIDEFPNAKIIASKITSISWTKARRTCKRIAKYNRRTKTFKYYPESWSIWIPAKIFIYCDGDAPFKIACDSNRQAEEYYIELSEKLEKQLTCQS